MASQNALDQRRDVPRVGTSLRMEGTFTHPMPTADGKTIPPTGKPYKITMCTVGHWKDGVMDEEYLFWDNLTFMKQIGLMQ